jgi:hypothetical protein
MPNNYQEPVEQKDLDLGKKLSEERVEGGENVPAATQKEIISIPDIAAKTGPEKQEEKVSEKIETARKTISTQQTASVANVVSDAQSVSEIEEYEKKVEKLVEMAVQKGPEHAIQVARHMDKGKDLSAADNYTLDEVHDKLMENELRGQLLQKGLLKEL